MNSLTSHLLGVLAFMLCLAARVFPQEKGFEPLSRLHFKPGDHALGDVHPFFHDGECFLYYLKPGKYEAALARSRDLRHWTETALSHEGAGPDDWFSPYYVLGVFRDEAAGVFRSFFGHMEGRMASSASRDLLRWSSASRDFHVPPADYYERRRDPFVFWIPEMNEYGCVMTAWMKDQPKEKGGAVCLATSPDLKAWRDHGPIIHPGDIGEPECPQMFRLGGRWHLLASIYDQAVGRPVYWTGTHPLGKWESKPAGTLDGKDLCAAQIAFDGDTPLLFGWAPLKPARPGQQTWGGSLALPREVFGLPDGRLGVRLPEKLSQTFAALTWRDFPDQALGAEARKLDGSWKRLSAECFLSLPPGAGELRFRVHPVGEVSIRHDLLRVLDSGGEAWSELPVALAEGTPEPVSLFVDGDLVEVFVGGRYALVARLPAAEGDLSVSLQAKGAAPEVTSLRISEWAAQP